MKFGVEFTSDYNNPTEAYKALVASEAGLLVPGVESIASSWLDVYRTPNWTRLDNFVAFAKPTGLPWRSPSGFIYPAHDMDWVASNPPTAATWQSEIDFIVSAFRTKMDALIAAGWWLPESINITNETTSTSTGTGWISSPWFTAAGGPQWIVYLSQRLRAAFPTVPLILCQDLIEQQMPDSWQVSFANQFITNIDALIAAGAQIDGIDLQGHLTFTRGWDTNNFRTTLNAIKSRGLKIYVGEIDIRSGGSPSSYTIPGYDALAAQMVAQYLNVIVPFLEAGSHLCVWGLADPYNSWTSDERPLLFDSTLTKKTGMYNAFLNALGV